MYEIPSYMTLEQRYLNVENNSAFCVPWREIQHISLVNAEFKSQTNFDTSVFILQPAWYFATTIAFRNNIDLIWTGRQGNRVRNWGTDDQEVYSHLGLLEIPCNVAHSSEADLWFPVEEGRNSMGATTLGFTTISKQKPKEIKENLAPQCPELSRGSYYQFFTGQVYSWILIWDGGYEYAITASQLRWCAKVSRWWSRSTKEKKVFLFQFPIESYHV